MHQILKNIRKKWFNSKENLKEYLKKYYMVNIPEDDTDTIYIKNQENFKTFKYKNKYLTSFINYSNFSIYCLSSQIIANSRLKMISTMKNFYNSIHLRFVIVILILFIYQYKKQISRFYE